MYMTRRKEATCSIQGYAFCQRHIIAIAGCKLRPGKWTSVSQTRESDVQLMRNSIVWRGRVGGARGHDQCGGESGMRTQRRPCKRVE